jgi:hypothetical protein
VWRQFLTPNSFTLEASFCGADVGPGAGAHYTIAHLKEMGATFVPALIEFSDPVQTRVQQIMADLEQQYPTPDEDVHVRRLRAQDKTINARCVGVQGDDCEADADVPRGSETVGDNSDKAEAHARI